jgi:putative transposase
MTAADLVDKLLASEHGDVLRDSVAWLVAEVMEAEVGELTGAGLGERPPERRQAQRNGYRPRRWDTSVGELELAIPKLRQGSYFPSLLEPRRRAEQAVVAMQLCPPRPAPGGGPAHRVLSRRSMPTITSYTTNAT